MTIASILAFLISDGPQTIAAIESVGTLISEAFDANQLTAAQKTELDAAQQAAHTQLQSDSTS